MASKTYRAVIEHSGKPKTLEVIATGSKERCLGAIEAWSSTYTIDTPKDGTPLIVVEVAQ